MINEAGEKHNTKPRKNNTMKHDTKQVEYIELILTRQRNPLPKGVKGHWHHIIPTCCGGPNEAWNKVKLTPEEHLKAHCLLPFIITEQKYQDQLVLGWNVLSGKFKHLRPFIPEWDELKEMAKAASSRRRKGVPNSPEARRKMGDAHRGTKQSPEWIAKRTRKQRKPVIAAKDGVEMEFASVKEAAKSLGFSQPNVSTCLTKSRPSRGYTFRYKEAL